MKKNYIIIPALEPESRFCDYVRKLQKIQNSHIVVIDDGSGENYQTVFQILSHMQNCVVLTHHRNRGKGAALKTGFLYVKEQSNEGDHIVCADCDGQHAVEDVAAICEKIKKYPGTLILGSRDFRGGNIPLRSLIGNRTASFFLWILSGRWLADTQTGFRAFDTGLLDLMLEVPGTRFEYEMQALLTCIQKKIPIQSESIQTIYQDGNSGSHFRPVRDSFGVVGVLFSNICKFGLSSFLCAWLDVFLFWFLLNMTGNGNRMFGLHAVFAATVAARIISAGTNYMMNRHLVFENKTRAHSLMRYALLCCALTAASAVSVFGMNRILHISPAASKILCDSILFFVSYRIQKNWEWGTSGLPAMFMQKLEITITLSQRQVLL